MYGRRLFALGAVGAAPLLSLECLDSSLFSPRASPLGPGNADFAFDANEAGTEVDFAEKTYTMHC